MPQVRFAAIDGTTISTSSTSASTTGLLTSGSSTIGDKSTVPSGSPADSPSSGSESTGGAVASEASGSQGSQGSQERRVDSQTAMLANVADVNLLIGKLSLEGTPSPAEFKHSPETALSLLEGCCRASIPQPADSTYNRDLSHSFNPLSPHTPASYPTTHLPQFDDLNFFQRFGPEATI